MTGILRYFSRSLTRSLTTNVGHPLERTSIQSRWKNVRCYHRNVANFVSRINTQEHCLKPICQPLMFINRRIQTTPVLGTTKDVVVPQFADSISEGDVNFLKQVGDEVDEDEVVCEIETDKTSVEVPSPGKGVIEELYVENGSVVKPGMKLLRIKIKA